ncbi:MAG: DNA-directed DNA polymerase II small subunit [Candidatus Altiarchaeota archaeon]|nr:DNA-directed DNA polymerase II small subunit [Candidatus Altiarchaeota archaeon]
MMAEDTVKQGIVGTLAKEGLMVSPYCLDLIIERKVDVAELAKDAKKAGVWMITDEFLRGFIKLDTELSKAAKELAGVEQAEKAVEVVSTRKILAKEVESRLVIDDATDVTDKSTCDGTIENFVEYFNQRYRTIRDILRERPECRTAMTVEAAKKHPGEKLRVICMVTEKRESKKGYRFLEVEDPTGSLTGLITKEKEEVVRLYTRLLADEVICLEGTFRDNLFLVDSITQPDIPYNSQPRKADEEVYAAFLSDVHVGSYLFMEREFYRFIEWLNGKGPETEIAGKVKYVLIAGDLVDGIGVYPSQEKELTIPDIYKQYDFFAKLLEDIPSYIEIVLGMGNHDAVRGAEPQPRLDREIGGALYDLPNVHVVGNPVYLSMHGVRTLMYHGTSLDTIIGNLSDCSYGAPEKAMMQYLIRRNLVPSYGGDKKSGDMIAPESKDYLAIKEVPDIFHCGHVHTNGYATYKGVKIINSGTWQAKTKYQEQLGHQPTPCRVPVINLQNHEVSIQYFKND